MQNVNFKSIEEFFEFIPADELKIVEALRKIILECIPDCEERLSLNVPFYRRHSNICFIWPPSITWGGVSHKGVQLGFTNGNLLQDEIGYLNRGKRKQVYWKDFSDVKGIDEKLLQTYLHEAALIDSEKAKKKSKKIKRSLS
ncbi:MAG: DUF1801 domain-containing protein [Bacteroidetes bacterium]|nr:DUF1801 domain-containing protein [Bacteroidota bacterium]